MQPLRFIGVTLIIIGIIVLAYAGMTYNTQAKAAGAGTLPVMTEKTPSTSWPPILGGLAFFSGIAVIVIGLRRQ